MVDSEQLIRERAYHLWLQDGCPEGRADYHWHVAHEQVLGSLRTAGSAATATTKRAPAGQRATRSHRTAVLQASAKGAKNVQQARA
ncbi:MAG TPA: DUF2934 domain-containing protein [Xanthobacteraceae bacterium]|jgi:hypothetical protein